MSIIIDNEFKTLIPPLTSEEYKQLEENCVKAGIRDALVVWPQDDGNNILIEGHNRFEISANHGGIPFETKSMYFSGRDAAKRWIIENQFGRRNLSAYDRSILALKLKPLIAEKAKEQQGTRTDIRQISDKSSIDTKKELAAIAGVSHDTIHKVEVIEREATPETKQLVREGQISINQAYTETKKPHVSFNSGNNEWYTPSEIIEAARLAMGSIDLDPASSEVAQKTVKAKVYYTVETNGLDKAWTGDVWMNPPYASDLIGLFVRKLADEYGNYKQAVVLVNNATETEWFNELISIASAVCFPKGRVKFYMPDGKTGAPLQGQAVVYIGEEWEDFIGAFSDIGWGAVLVGA